MATSVQGTYRWKHSTTCPAPPRHSAGGICSRSEKLRLFPVADTGDDGGSHPQPEWGSLPPVVPSSLSLTLTKPARPPKPPSAPRGDAHPSAVGETAKGGGSWPGRGETPIATSAECAGKNALVSGRLGWLVPSERFSILCNSRATAHCQQPRRHAPVLERTIPAWK